MLQYSFSARGVSAIAWRRWPKPRVRPGVGCMWPLALRKVPAAADTISYNYLLSGLSWTSLPYEFNGKATASSLWAWLVRVECHSLLH